MLNPETLSKTAEKALFNKEFMELYNTATFSNPKYYSIENHEKRMAAIRSGETLAGVDDAYDPEKDLAAVRQSHKRAPVEQESYLNRSQLEELRKISNERVEMEKMKRLGIKVKDSMGVRMDSKI
ncbi:hypothetical protein MNV49_005306 [Pseudohyphozyma bogoriensis]|nr:hypothetical protein MNV49_005306 [Pseudohyphozyma bogoriensis]